MGTVITQYQADDGVIFATETEMVAHEKSLDEARVRTWVESIPEWPRGEAARATRLVLKFLEHERLMQQS